MRALLLAAGLGTRLKPITNTIPKCLVPIKGTPLLEIWLERLSAAGIGPFLINTHYLPDQVENFISNSPLHRQVTLVHETKLVGTAGTLIENIEFFQGEDGMLIHADNYCMADLTAFLKAHQSRPDECLITMMTFRTDTPQSCGIVELDDRNIVVGFHEKVEHPPGDLANGAVYLLSAKILEEIASKYTSVQEFTTEILPHYMGRIHSYETTESFADIGTPEKYHAAQHY